MTDRPSPAHGPAPGISRATAFRPSVVFRVVLAVLAATFAVLVLQALLADPISDPAPAVLSLVLLGAATYAATRAWTTRVWVETSYPPGWTPGTSPDPDRAATITELLADLPASRTLFVVESAGLTGVRRREALLEHPTTIALTGAALTGARPSWCLSVTTPPRADRPDRPGRPGRPGRPAETVRVRAPWLTDLAPLLTRLRHVVAQDERLAADADTLALVLGRRPLNERR